VTRRHLLYIIGVPGSGKTTLARELVLGRRRRVIKEPFAHTIYEDGLVQLGRDREGHGGTDALSMSVQPHVIDALEIAGWPAVLGEGDRLTNRAFFEAVRHVGYHLDVVLLSVPNELAAVRRVQRGSTQDERWLRGRERKVDNLRDMATIVLDGARPAAELVGQLKDHPVIRR
jgi:hypothetical protein